MVAPLVFTIAVVWRQFSAEKLLAGYNIWLDIIIF